MATVIAQPCGVFNKTSFDLCVECWHGLVIERHLSADKDIEDNAKAPYVDLWSSVNLGIQ